MATFLVGCHQTETTQPVQSDIIDAVFASGHIVSDQEYKVTANTEGYLIHSFVEEGVAVKADMPLFQISNNVQSEQVSNARVVYEDALQKLKKNAPEQVQLRLQIEQAKSQMELDKKNFERYEKLLASNAVSQVDFDKAKLQYENAVRNVDLQEKALEDLINNLELSAKNAESQLIIQKENNADYFLSSSIAGEVLQVLKKPGELVRRGEVVAVIGGGEKRAKLYISEEDIREIALNQTVVVDLNTEIGKTYEAEVAKIFPSFDEVEQSFIVEATFKSEPAVLYHNTQLQANIVIGQRENAWVIPTQFLSPGDSVQLESGTRQYVQVGLRNDQWVEILGGVKPADVLQKPENL
ncbi:MAG: HlyD family efflux transporter periplasmic adaptor subunit [Bacteroidota bacterium]